MSGPQKPSGGEWWNEDDERDTILRKILEVAGYFGDPDKLPKASTDRCRICNYHKAIS
jgi:hypothetical protein